ALNSAANSRVRFARLASYSPMRRAISALVARAISGLISGSVCRFDAMRASLCPTAVPQTDTDRFISARAAKPACERLDLGGIASVERIAARDDADGLAAAALAL